MQTASAACAVSGACAVPGACAAVPAAVAAIPADGRAWWARVVCALAACLLAASAPTLGVVGAASVVGALAWAAHASAQDAPQAAGALIPPHLWFLPPSPRDATLLGRWPTAADVAALEAALPPLDPTAPAAQRLRVTFAREHVALLRAYLPLVARARVGDVTVSPLDATTYAESAALLPSIPAGEAADLEAIRATVFAAEGRAADALSALTEAQRLTPKPDPDWRAGAALFAARLSAQAGRPPTAADLAALTSLPTLASSSQWAALTEAAALAALTPPPAAPGTPTPSDATLAARRARHALSLIERLHSSGALEAGVPLSLLQDHLLTLARASAHLPAGWLTLCDSVALLPDRARAPLLRALTADHDASAPPLHAAHLHLCAFESDPKPSADLILHLEAAAEVAARKLPPADAAPLCDLVLPQLRASRPWWQSWSRLPEPRARAHAVIRRCLDAQLAAAADPDAQLAALDAASADHLDAFTASHHAQFALALLRRGDHPQAYALLSAPALSPPPPDLPPALAAELTTAHLDLAIRLNKDLQLSHLACASLTPTPASPEQATLLRLLTVPDTLTKKGAAPPTASPRPDLTAPQLAALLALQLHLARYSDSLPTARALLSHPDAALSSAASPLPTSFAALTRCLHSAHRWPLAAALIPLLRDLPPPQRAKLLASPSVPSTPTSPSLDHLLQDALLHHARALMFMSPPQPKQAIQAIQDAQSVWLHAPLSAALLLTLAQAQQQAALPDDALLTLTSLADLHPRDPLSDDALWLAAHLSLDLKRPAQARDLLKKILSDHPSGSHLWRANDLLSTLPPDP